MQNRRVVVTGCGAMSPNGLGRESFWKNTRAGVSGIRRITAFDPSPFTTKIAGEIVGFEPERYLGVKDRPHVSRAVPLALAASQEALEDAGLDPEAMDLEA